MHLSNSESTLAQGYQLGMSSPRFLQRATADTKTKSILDSQTTKRFQMTETNFPNQKQSTEFELKTMKMELMAAQKERDIAVEELARFKQNCKCSELSNMVENLRSQLVKKANMLSEITLKEQELHKAYDLNMSKMAMAIDNLRKGRSSPSSLTELDGDRRVQRLEEELQLYRAQMDQMREMMKINIPLIETLISTQNRSSTTTVSSTKRHGSPRMTSSYLNGKSEGLCENETIQKLWKFAEQIRSQIDELEKFSTKISASNGRTSLERTGYTASTPRSRNGSPSPTSWVQDTSINGHLVDNREAYTTSQRDSCKTGVSTLTPRESYKSDISTDSNGKTLQKGKVAMNRKRSVQEESNSHRQTPRSMNGLPASDSKKGKVNGESSTPQSLTQLTPKHDANGTKRSISPITEMMNRIRQSNQTTTPPKASLRAVDGSSQSSKMQRFTKSNGFEGYKNMQESQPASFSWNYENFRYFTPVHNNHHKNESFGQPANDREGEMDGSFEFKKSCHIPLLNLEKSSRGSEEDTSSLAGKSSSNKDKSDDADLTPNHLEALRRNVDTYWHLSNQENAKDIHQPCKHYAKNLENRLDSLEAKLNSIESCEKAIRERMEKFEQNRELKAANHNKDNKENSKIKTLETELEKLRAQLQEFGRLSVQKNDEKASVNDDTAKAQEKEPKNSKTMNSPKQNKEIPNRRSLGQVEAIDVDAKPKIRKLSRGPNSVYAKPTDIDTVQDERVKEIERIAKLQGESLKQKGVEDCGLILGIDCTISNISTGKKSFSQHHLHDISARKLNFYEKVISIMGGFVELFSQDGRFPVYIFGDDKTRDKRVRPLYQDKEGYEECFGVAHALAEYRKQIPKICLSGPTSFKPLIQTAIEITKIKEQFQILIIIGDGAVTDMNETIQAIIEASKYPILIIMVGVGDGEPKKHPKDPWLAMKKLEQEIPERKFMNFHFIPFHKGMEPQEFAQKTLSKVSTAYKFCLENGMIQHYSSS